MWIHCLLLFTFDACNYYKLSFTWRLHFVSYRHKCFPLNGITRITYTNNEICLCTIVAYYCNSVRLPTYSMWHTSYPMCWFSNTCEFFSGNKLVASWAPQSKCWNSCDAALCACGHRGLRHNCSNISLLSLGPRQQIILVHRTVYLYSPMVRSILVIEIHFFKKRKKIKCFNLYL